MKPRAFVELCRILANGAWRQNRGRLALTIVALALGVALGSAVHLINHSAATELETAVRALSGEADLRVSGPRSGFDEAVYPLLARRSDVAVASPVVELDAKLVDPATTLRVVGLDPFRALALQPGLLGDAGERLLELLEPDSVMLSRAAAQQLGRSAGDRIAVQVGLRTAWLRIIAILPTNDAFRQPLMLMDIASAQWTFGHLGKLSRIDVRLRPGTDPEAARAGIDREMPAGVYAAGIAQAAEQGLALSRAYRVNLNMLALVSLFTGAVLVFSTQTLSALRRRTHLALLRALGVPGRTVGALLALEAAVFGAIGTTLGLFLGILTAYLAIAYAGGDLGAGYFSAVVTRIAIDPGGLALIAMCGMLASLLGGWLPALEAARAHPAPALRAGDEQGSVTRLPASLAGACMLSLGGALALLPPVQGLPLFGYAAIACLLVGALMLMPAYVRWALGAIRPPRAAPAWIGLQQLRGTPAYAGISLAAIVASFSLTVSMLIMIHSFRGSLETWLEIVLPADVYARAGAASSTLLDPSMQARILQAAPVERAAFSRFESVRLRPDRPPITVIARDIDANQPDALPLVSAQLLPRPGAHPAWISEAMRDLYGLRIGQALQLPLAGEVVELIVAGVWRDYVRQHGAVLVPRSVYTAATGDQHANEAWIWLRPGYDDPPTAVRALRQALAVGSEIELREPGLLRQLSLAAFDRTFAVTYALQVAAVLIGLFGISIGTSAQALARRHEFGMLHHLGLARRDLRTMLAVEGGVVGALGAAAGIAVGGIISLILIHVVNRQSFHWSMEIHVPWLGLTLIVSALCICASVTAALSGGRALGDDIVRAVKEDW